MVVYSLASPRRQHPKTGEVFNSTLKPIGKNVVQQGVDTNKNVIKEFTIEAANQDEIDNTVAVMGGEDWQMWIDALQAADVLAPGCKTTAYTYVGEAVTRDIYWDGTIGAAKKDLDKKVIDIRQALQSIDGDARVSVLKAVVTQASAAIPVMPLYLGLLFKVMKQKGTHEGCIEQIDLLFRESLYGNQPQIDDVGRLRADYKEIEPAVQQEVEQLWAQINDDNLNEISDMQGYMDEFLRLFGFGIDGVDYEAEVNPVADIDALITA